MYTLIRADDPFRDERSVLHGHVAEEHDELRKAVTRVNIAPAQSVLDNELELVHAAVVILDVGWSDLAVDIGEKSEKTEVSGLAATSASALRQLVDILKNLIFAEECACVAKRFLKLGLNELDALLGDIERFRYLSVKKLDLV